MPKITINLLGFNHREKIGATIKSVLAQSFSDFELIYTDNASSDSSLDFVRENFSQVRVIANQKNLGYASGHNVAIRETQSELFMVLNPDVILDKRYLENILTAFTDPKLAAATGKMLRPFSSGERILDGTGIIVGKSRRARERGQLEVDRGQYDKETEVFGVSGTAAVYRRAALEQVKVPLNSSRGESVRRPPGEGEFEYFDEDFFAYWEDLDLSWRLRLAGFKCRYVPLAICYHERLASSSPGGYKRVWSFVQHHRKLPLKVRRWNWKNHLFCIVKNDFGWPLWRDFPYIVAREAAMLAFILLFEIRTLGVLAEFVRELPKIVAKRKYIMIHKTVDSGQISGCFK